jgi:hypothetical protein
MRNHLYSCNEAQDSGDFGVGRKPVVSIPPTTPRELTCGASPACRPPRARRGSSSRSPLALLAGLVKLFDPAAQAALTDPGRRACAVCAVLSVPGRPCSSCLRSHCRSRPVTPRPPRLHSHAGHVAAAVKQAVRRPRRSRCVPSIVRNKDNEHQNITRIASNGKAGGINEAYNGSWPLAGTNTNLYT